MLTDCILIFAIIIFQIIGFWRGFIAEALGIISLTGVILLTSKYFMIIGNYFHFNFLAFNYISGFVILYILLTMVFFILTSTINTLLLPIRHGSIDRLLGFCIGSIKGIALSILALFIIVIASNIFYTPEESLFIKNNKQNNQQQKVNDSIPPWLRGSYSYAIYTLLDSEIDEIFMNDKNHKKLMTARESLDNFFNEILENYKNEKKNDTISKTQENRKK
ncbi:MAG: CvpA family protein [Anaplasmataceae bacterium]|nr:CvpA family protein [Anaplasmataceae bacterium]